MVKDDKNVFSIILKGQRIKFSVSLFCVAVSAYLSYLPQQVLRFTVDSVIDSQPPSLPGFLYALYARLGGREWFAQHLWALALAMLAASAASGIFIYLRGRLASQYSESGVMHLRNELYDHIQNLPYDYRHEGGSGDLLQRCTSDIETIRRFFAMQVIEVVRALCMVVSALFVMLPMSAKMTGISLFSVPFILVFSYFYYKKVRRNFQKSDEAEGRLSVTLQENLTGVRVVRAFGQQEAERRRFNQRSGEYRALDRRLVNLMAYYWSVSDLIIYLQLCATVCFGISMVISGELTVGMLISFISYTGMLLWPVRMMGRVLADMGKALVSAGRIRQILSVPVEEDFPSAAEPEIKGDVEFKNVSFGYGDGCSVLEDISFHAEPGQTIAILGPTGSGKSTVANLLQRLYKPASGQILIDGTDINTIRRKWLRRNVGLVLQEPFLYSRSIMDNIRITDPSASEAAVFEAAQTAFIHQAALEFDKGYDTVIGERGVTLSGGQKQRVAIARTLLTEAPIMVFDDSLSAVDAKTDAAIRSSLQRNRKGRTTFIISHRINTIKDADMILVLSEGRITQRGTHEKLVSEDGLYRRIWEIQSMEEGEKNA